MYRGFALGVVFISCFYVAGYTYKYSFFGYVTNEVGWLSLLSVDYVGWGVYALIDFFRINCVILVVAFSAALTYFRSVVDFFYKSTRTLLNGDIYKQIFRSASVLFAVLLYYAIGMVTLMMVTQGIFGIQELAKKDLFEFLRSGRVDEICYFGGEECREGKLMYSGSDVYVFYHHLSDAPDEGKILVVSKREAYAKVGWNNKSREMFIESSEEILSQARHSAD